MRCVYVCVVVNASTNGMRAVLSTSIASHYRTGRPQQAIDLWQSLITLASEEGTTNVNNSEQWKQQALAARDKREVSSALLTLIVTRMCANATRAQAIPMPPREMTRMTLTTQSFNV